MRRRTTGGATPDATWVLAATAVAGGAGYLVTVIAGVALGAAGYSAFGVLWSALFFAVGALYGLQQEVARATRPTDDPRPPRVVRDVAILVAATAGVLAVATGPLWADHVIPGSGLVTPAILGAGLACQVLMAAIIGVLFGLREIRIAAIAIALDGVLRLVATAIALAVSDSLEIVAAALVLPYFVIPLLLVLIARRRFVKRSVTDVGRRLLARQAAGTMLAAAATGTLVSGFAALVSLGRVVDPSHLGAVIFAVNVARAPLIIVVLSMQTLLVVQLRDRADWRRRALLLMAVVAIAAVVLAGLAGAVGPWLLAALLPGGTLAPGLLAAIVGSGGLVAVLCVSGPAVLSHGRHAFYIAGWVTAAAVTVATLFAPWDFDVMVVVALVAGPVAGILVHLVGFVARGGDQSAAPPPAP